jgi:hypothetical protein
VTSLHHLSSHQSLLDASLTAIVMAGFVYSFHHPFFKADCYQLACAINILDGPHAQLVTDLEINERVRASCRVGLVHNQAA